LRGWDVRTHLQVSAARAREGGPRGATETFSANHVMVSARRASGSSVWGVQSMWSLEPWMGAEGYPLLTQTGETDDGITALVDRQHPHDLPMELAVTYARSLDAGRGMFLYAGPVGAPALGPPPFMHRASGAALPIAPITHHWFDSTHISFGVVTVGFVSSPRVKFEASVFRGREPDHHRWGFEAPALDSFAARLSINPTPSLALQASAGVLNDAEQLHPGADVGRMTLSLMYTRQWRWADLDATVAWGRNTRTPTALPLPGGVLLLPGVITRAMLAEATLRAASRHAVVTRVEHAQKDELFGRKDPRHGQIVPVWRTSLGYVHDLIRMPRLVGSVGVAASWVRVPAAIRPEYGGPPVSSLIFAGVQMH
jgi:hypothetical protein